MKKIIGYMTAALSAAILVCCTPESRPHLPEEGITDLKIVVTQLEEQNTYLLRTNRTDVIGFWDLGNGNTASGVNSVVAKYPFAGTYTVSLTAYGSAGKTNEVSMKIRVVSTNFNLLSDPMYTYIAGEIGGEGKTWKLDSQREGHLRTVNRSNGEYSWTAGANAKADTGMYDDRATFILNGERGQGFDYYNNGKCCAINNDNCVKALYGDPSWEATSYNKASTNDYVVNCTPPQGMGWSLVEQAGKYFITFSSVPSGHGGLLFYFAGWDATYEIYAISETNMRIRMVSPTGNNGSLQEREMNLCTETGAPGPEEEIEWEWTRPE